MLHIASEYNFAGILTKHWSYQRTYHESIQPVFNHEGITGVLYLDDTLEVDAYINEEDSKMTFGILGSDRTLCQPKKRTLESGKTTAIRKSTLANT